LQANLSCHENASSQIFFNQKTYSPGLVGTMGDAATSIPLAKVKA
jgi:hypothetical protein